MADGDKEEKKGGEVVFAGYASWSLVGKNGKAGDFDGVEDQILWGFHRLRPLLNVKITKVISGPVSCTCIALAANGACYTWGRNKHGQLGSGSTVNLYNPTLVEIPNGESITGGACGPNHTMLVSATGSLFAAGANKCGQLGTGRKADSVKKFVNVNMDCVVTRVACGREFTMIVDSNGLIYSCGHPEYGCLGNGTESKILERSNKFTYDFVTIPSPVVALPKAYGDVRIKDVACGAKHTCAMDEEGRIYTWGFGAYGRLGHNDNKNQMEPTAVELFSFEPPPPRPDIPKFLQAMQPKIRASKITCGNTATYVVAGEPYNSLYMFGITKKTGEANMKPTIVDNVQGWRVRSVSVGNTSTAVASERSLITWGPSPTFGELGYGDGADEPKSSTVSREVKALKGSLVMQVASGMAHTLALVDVDDARGKEKVEALEVFEPAEVDPTIAKAAAAKAAAERSAKRKTSKKKASADNGDDDDDDDDDDGDDEEAEDDEDADVASDDESDGEDQDEDDEEDYKPEGRGSKRKAPAKAPAGRAKARGAAANKRKARK